jgi:hypothetical protein
MEQNPYLLKDKTRYKKLLFRVDYKGFKGACARSALIGASTQVRDQDGQIIDPLTLKPHFFGFTSLYWASILSVNHELECGASARLIKKACDADPLICPIKWSDAAPGGYHSPPE